MGSGPGRRGEVPFSPPPWSRRRCGRDNLGLGRPVARQFRLLSKSSVARRVAAAGIVGRSGHQRRRRV
eukprot:7283370-Pyramimonas_sp.AAC.1